MAGSERHIEGRGSLCRTTLSVDPSGTFSQQRARAGRFSLAFGFSSERPLISVNGLKMSPLPLVYGSASGRLITTPQGILLLSPRVCCVYLIYVLFGHRRHQPAWSNSYFPRGSPDSQSVRTFIPYGAFFFAVYFRAGHIFPGVALVRWPLEAASPRADSGPE